LKKAQFAPPLGPSILTAWRCGLVEVAHDGEGRSGSSEVAECGRPELGLARGKAEKDEGTMAHAMKGSTRAHGAGKVVLHPPWRAAASCSSEQSRAREGGRERGETRPGASSPRCGAPVVVCHRGEASMKVIDGGSTLEWW